VIKFHKVNETYCVLVAEQHVLMEVAPHFTYIMPNYQWTPQYKKSKGKWNGEIKLLSPITGRFLLGLLKRVILKCQELGYNEFTFEGFENSGPEFTEDYILDFIEQLSLPEDRQPREYQLNAILSSLMANRRLILSPTSSGKSLIIYIMFRILLEADKKILLVVPNSMLVDQMFLDFETYAVNNKFDVEEFAHKIYTGQSKNSPKPIYISTWQSIDAIPKEDLGDYLEQFDAIMVDEVHGADAKSLRTIVEGCINAKHRTGFTGTLKDSLTSELTLIGLFGSIKKMISIRELMDKGLVADLTIKCIILKYPEEMRQAVQGLEYDDELSMVLAYERRNKFIANLANSLDGNTLTILRFIEKHAVGLKELYEAKNRRPVFLLTGDLDKDEKTLIRQNMENINDADLMGTWGMVSTGMSIINLHNGIFASPSKSRVKVIQALGRLLRKGLNKTTAVQYDIVDNLSYEGDPNYLMKHFFQRYKYYREEQFRIEFIEVEIR
jgi:superfamily II DNA or RNA helicase